MTESAELLSWSGLNGRYGRCVSPRPGSVVVEPSPGMREVGGSIPGRVKQNTLKFEVLVLCLSLSIKELETDWLGVRIIVWVGTSLPTRGMIGRRSD